MKKKVIIILAVVVCVLLLVVALYFAWRVAYQIWGGEEGFEAEILSVEDNIITAKVAYENRDSFLSPKLPDTIVFDADRCDGSELKVGDKISGTYLKGTIDGNNVCVVSVSVITEKMTEKITYSGEMVIKAINFSQVEAMTESQLILDLLNNGEWIDSLCDCFNDYTISLNGKVIRYSSGCGTFNNITDGTSLTLSDSEKASVNEYLESLFEGFDPNEE